MKRSWLIYPQLNQLEPGKHPQNLFYIQCLSLMTTTLVNFTTNNTHTQFLSYPCSANCRKKTTYGCLVFNSILCCIWCYNVSHRFDGPVIGNDTWGYRGILQGSKGLRADVTLTWVVVCCFFFLLMDRAFIKILHAWICFHMTQSRVLWMLFFCVISKVTNLFKTVIFLRM